MSVVSRCNGGSSVKAWCLRGYGLAVAWWSRGGDVVMPSRRRGDSVLVE